VAAKVWASGYRGTVTTPFFRTKKIAPAMKEVSRPFVAVAIGEFFLWENLIWKKIEVHGWGLWNAVSTERWAQFDDDVEVI